MNAPKAWRRTLFSQRLGGPPCVSIMTITPRMRRSGAQMFGSGTMWASTTNLKRQSNCLRAILTGLLSIRMAYGQLALKNHEAAIDWAKQAISEPIREWTSYLFLVSALEHMERSEDAKPALEDLYRPQPNVSIAYIQN